MDHRMVLHRSNLPGCWAPLPPTKAIVTGSDVLNDQELGDMRRAQEEAVTNKKKAHKKQWGVENVTKLLCLTRVPSKEKLPAPFNAAGQLEKE